MEYFNVPVTQIDPEIDSQRINSAQFSTFKDDRGFANLVVYPAYKYDGANQIVITAGEYHRIEPMKRLSRKRLETLLSEAQEQIENQQGYAWDLLQKLCSKHNLEVKLVTKSQRKPV